MPIGRAFDPSLVIVSAGFDAAAGDACGFELTPSCYGRLTAALASLAGGRVVVTLEGGYNVPAIARGLQACTAALLGAIDEEGGAGSCRRPARAS